MSLPDEYYDDYYAEMAFEILPEIPTEELLEERRLIEDEHDDIGATDVGLSQLSWINAEIARRLGQMGPLTHIMGWTEVEV